MARVYNRHFAQRERWMKLSEVIDFSGKSRRTIYRYIEAGRLCPKYQTMPSGAIARVFAESEVRKLFEPMTAREAMAHIN